MADFPATRLSIIEAARSEDAGARQRGFGTLVTIYWKPVYKHLRLKWHTPPEEAEDLTQGFFGRAYEKGFFDSYDPARSRFRTFLRVCLDGFVANERKATSRLKRGGEIDHVPLDFTAAEGELRFVREIATDADIEEQFHREWVRSIFALAVDSLRRDCEARGRATHFTLFERYDLADTTSGERPTYAALASELSLSINDVTNQLAAVRREFRRHAVDTLRDACASDAEFRTEARDLFGVELE